MADEKNQNSSSEEIIKKYNTPIQFTKEDILGEHWDEIHRINPYDDEPKKIEAMKKKKKFKLPKQLNILISKMRLPFVAAIIIFIAFFAVLFILCSSSLPINVIAKNVYIESLNVGGMTYDEALNAVKSTYLFENQTVTLKCSGNTFEFNGVDIGLSASPEETTQKAFEYAKSDSRLVNGFQAIGLLFGKHTIVPVANIDEAKLDEKLYEFGLQVHGELIGHYVEVRDNNEATVWPGHTGFDGDTSTAKREILKAFDAERFKNIPVTLNSAPPSDITLEQFDTAVYKDPVDAYYSVENNKATVIPEESGRYIDYAKVEPLLKAVKEGVEPVIVPWETSYAEITADTLQTKLFSKTLASYSTDYSSSSANRSANVARASELLNGAILGAGDIFSFNSQVGTRTKYNGFYTAPEYADGKTVEGIGGGTCQVSTTLYSAALYAGLDIISRTNHMFSVGYAPLGQDATVSDTGIDFQFRNNTDYPVKVCSYTDGVKIYVDIVGTAWEPARTIKLDHTVSYSSGGISVYSKRYCYDENGDCIYDEKLPSSFYKTQEQ